MKASPEPEGGRAVAVAVAAREADARWPRDGGKSEAEAERLRTRERLEATLAGLAELEFLRQRHELRVRRLLLGASPTGLGAAEPPQGEGAGAGAAPRSLEEKFLEENILLLRRQLVSPGGELGEARVPLSACRGLFRKEGGGHPWPPPRRLLSPADRGLFRGGGVLKGPLWSIHPARLIRVEAAGGRPRRPRNWGSRCLPPPNAQPENERIAGLRRCRI